MMHAINIAATDKLQRKMLIDALINNARGNTIEIEGSGPSFTMQKVVSDGKTHYRVHISEYQNWRDEITAQVFDVVVTDTHVDNHLEGFGLCTKLLVAHCGTYVVRKYVPDAPRYHEMINGVPLTERAPDSVIARVTSVSERQIVLDYKGREAKFSQPRFTGGLTDLVIAIETRLSALYPGLMVDPNDAESLVAYLDKPNNGPKSIIDIEKQDDYIRLSLKHIPSGAKSSRVFCNPTWRTNGIEHLRANLEGVFITDDDYEKIVSLGKEIDRWRAEAARLVDAELIGERITVTTEGRDGSRSTCDIDPFTARTHPTVMHNGTPVRLQLDLEGRIKMHQLKTELNVNLIEATRRK